MFEVSHKTSTVRVAALAVSILLPVMLFAQQGRVYRDGAYWVEEISGTLPASSRLSVRLPLGNIIIEGANRQNISYKLKKRVPAEEATARRQFEKYRFTALRLGDKAVLEGNFIGGHFLYSAELLVQAPQSLQLVRLFTHAGSESVTGIHGRVEVSTAGGNIHLDNLSGPVIASSAGGDVDAGAIGGDLTLRTGGGNIRIASVKGRIATFSGGGNITIGSGQMIRAETGGGQIEVQHCEGELTANTGGGSLDLGQIAGRANLQSAGGSIRLLAANGPVVANTGGGTIELYGLAHGAEVQTGAGPIVAEFLGHRFVGSSLETPSGDIVVYLGPDLKATVRASIDFANGHRIRSDFPELKVRMEGGPYGPKSVFAEGDLNGGGPVLRLRTMNGDIAIRRATK